MAWAIGSTKTPSNPQFRALRWRLLLSYLAVMVAILSLFTVAVYRFFALSLYRQLDNRLLTLADAATHSLEAIARQYPRGRQTADVGNFSRHTHPFTYEALLPRLDNDGDLDLPWQSIRQPDQGVEWFDENRQLLAKAGRIFPKAPLPEDAPEGAWGHTVDGGKIRTLTLRVYDNSEPQSQLIGYVRIGESTAEVREILGQLRWGLVLGGAIASGLTAAGGMWLTRESLQPIEQSFRQLKQFTADASHELRNPLAGIKTCVEVMQSHPERLQPTDLEKVGAIASATGQMTRLVDDLLLLARSEGAVPQTVAWVAVPLDELLEDLAEFLQLRAADEGIAIATQLKPGISVRGDGAQLWRVFANLLENAINYTDAPGNVTIYLDRSEQWIVVRVEDTGIGIAPEHLPRVFDRLWRADRARSRREGGSGLGLAIAQTIVRQHGGEIAVTSQLGVGTCFHVRLPALNGESGVGSRESGVGN
ncbi:MAG: sensor histidine kinase [Limnospira sp.]